MERQRYHALRQRVQEGSTRVSGTGLRKRLVAILAADAAGYSRLMAIDERTTIEALDAARRVFRGQIESNQGRVIDTAGDSLLAVFETATGAVTAALAAQAELSALVAKAPEDRRMQFRIGVHLGDVIEKPDGTVYGDGVNIAARLQGLAEPGGVMVSESIRTAVRGKVDTAFDDQGEQQVKNIPHQVRAYRLSTLGQAMAAQEVKPRSVASEINLSLPGKPSIAVLPFTNMSSDADQEYFTDGITADVITELSRFRSLFVIARNSTFTYKGQAVDVRTVARELGVRYVLEGSVRLAGNRVRVTGQLIDALTGNHLWAEKFDRLLEDIFAVQEEITRSIVAAIAPEIEASELERIGRVRPENFTAFEISMRAYAEVTEALPGTDHRLLESGSQLAAKALAIDPRSVSAWSAIACSKWQAVHYSLTSDREMTRQEGIDAASAAIAVDRADNRPYIWRGALRIYNHPSRQREGLADLRRAHELNPNDATAMVHLGFGEAVCGDPIRGRDHVLAAMRLSPRDPFRYGMYNVLGLAAFLAKDYAQGLEWSQLSCVERPNFTAAHRHAMLNCVGLGKFEQARAEADLIRRAAPGVFENYLRSGADFYTDPEHGRRGLLFTRIAAGLEDSSTKSGSKSPFIDCSIEDL